MLRPYQQQAVDDVLAHLNERPILCLPTGAGKTYTAVEIIKRFNRPTLFLAHRRELISQAAQHLVKYGLSCGIIQAGFAPRNHPIQVASVQTLARRSVPHADLVVIDEAHHVRAGTYLKILDKLPLALRLGLTATPARLDGRGLGAIFGTIIVGATPRQLCEDGTLLAPVVYAPPSESMSDVRIVAGEYDMAQAARRYDRPKIVGSIIDTWLKHGIGKRTVVFAINIQHSMNIVARFVEAGVTAEHLDGTASAIERARAISRWRSGETVVISNCGLFGEGFDLPALEVAVIARPTASMVWHLQSVGRVMRAADGKDGALVLDHVGNAHRHGMVTDDRQWSLDDRPRRAAPTEPPCKTCPACYLVCHARALQCACGYVFTVETTVPKEADGELVRIGPKQAAFWDDVARRAKILTNDNKKRFWSNVYQIANELRNERLDAGWYGAFKRIANERGYKAGWPSVAFKNRFGRWPTAQEKAYATHV